MRAPRLACALVLVVWAACSAGNSGAPVDGGSGADARLPDARGGSGADAPRNVDAAPGAPDAPPGDRDGGVTGGDTYVPWEGGPVYYAGWSHGLPTDTSFFPIAVFWQSAANADDFAAIGINTYIGFFSDDDLTALDQKSMHVVGDQTAVDWHSRLGDTKINGWSQNDEPDNAQPKAGGGYDPCIDPSVIQGLYATFTMNDASRPVFLNLGRGVAATSWVGRGTCTGHTEMYPEYAKGADVLSFDIYPVNSTDEAKNKLYFVADGIDRLRQAVQNRKPVYAYVETTDIGSAGTTPTPAQIKAEVWMTLIHGARLVAYFSHVFAADGSYLHDDGLLRTASSKAAVTAIDAQIAALAPVLNTQSLANGATVSSATQVDIMVKRYQGALYVFAVAMRAGATHASFALRGVGTATAEVIGESRSMPVANGAFADDFAADYTVHLYRIP